MARYQELAPPLHLADSVECFWTLEAEKSIRHRVLPDGCADIVFSPCSGGASLVVVGMMTRFADFAIPAGQLSVGVRFRLGMWKEHFGIPSPDIIDTTLPIESLWGARGTALLKRVESASSPQQCVALLGQGLRPPRTRTPVQRALAWMEAEPECVSLDDVALQAGLSARQFRRICLQQTGVSPKLLARVLRFRKALTQVQIQADELAGIAADCGFFDQSHFTAEFQRFAGQTPAAYLHNAR